MVDERLIGFDLRENWINDDPLWTPRRRATFLLRDEVKKPLSTDVLVWSSVFDKGQGRTLPAYERAFLRLDGIPMPNRVGTNAGLWDNLDSMLQTARQYTRHNWIVPRRCSVIAITWVSDAGFADAGAVGPYPARTTPDVLSPRWRFLGCDVSDGSLLSGLSNCAYPQDEVSILRAQWGNQLNEHHLFVANNEAFAFRDLTNNRVLEHAPFFVYRLYEIDDQMTW